MSEHKLDLLSNALDSFNESLSKYRAGQDGDARAYKFAILHFAHFLELLFKHYVTQAHPLLIYKNPFAANLDKQQTIGLWEAVQFLQNEGHDFDAEFKSDLAWLKQLRNNIEHQHFQMDLPQVRNTLGRLTRALLEFNDSVSEFDVEDHIEAANLEVFETLSDEYKAAIAAAEARAVEESDDQDSTLCHNCFNATAGRIGNEFKCFYCDFTDSLKGCCVCGSTERLSEMSMWNEEHGDHICESCETRIRSM